MTPAGRVPFEVDCRNVAAETPNLGERVGEEGSGVEGSGAWGFNGKSTLLPTKNQIVASADRF